MKSYCTLKKEREKKKTSLYILIRYVNKCFYIKNVINYFNLYNIINLFYKILNSRNIKAMIDYF